jgi:hypothetical protein
VFAVEEVRCVDGCGETLPIVIGLVVAAISAVISGFAVFDARRSRRAAEQSLRIAQEQHAVFLEERSARADFTVELSVQHPPPERRALRAASGGQAVRVRLRVTNVGTRAANPLRMNLLYPERCTAERWTGEDGSWITGEVPVPITADESLQVAGEPIATNQVYREWESLIPDSVMIAFFQVAVPLDEGWPEVEVPFSVRAWADHMPDGIDNRRDDVVITLRHDPRAPG